MAHLRTLVGDLQRLRWTAMYEQVLAGVIGWRESKSLSSLNHFCPERIVLAEVALTTPPSLLLLARGATRARLPLRLFVPLRDLLLERGDRRVRRRSSRSGLIRLLSHWTCTPRRSLRTLGHRTNAGARHRTVETGSLLYRCIPPGQQIRVLLRNPRTHSTGAGEARTARQRLRQLGHPVRNAGFGTC